jgi:predicted acylesterase/phospholipase RssA
MCAAKSSTATRTAFVLAGGGSIGAVQVGMLRELLAHGVAPDLIVGSSVGSINGAYFAGAPGAEGVQRLEAIWRGLQRRQVFPVTWRSTTRAIMQGGPLVDPPACGGCWKRTCRTESWSVPRFPCTLWRPICSAAAS